MSKRLFVFSCVLLIVSCWIVACADDDDDFTDDDAPIDDDAATDDDQASDDDSSDDDLQPDDDSTIDDDIGDDDAADDDVSTCDEEKYQLCKFGRERAFEECQVGCSGYMYDSCLYEACLGDCGIDYQLGLIECAEIFNCPESISYFQCIIQCYEEHSECLKPLLTCNNGRALACHILATKCYRDNCGQ